MRKIDMSKFSCEGLIFDCDGTLADTAPFHYESLRAALEEQGIDLPRDWYFARVGLSRAVLLREFEQAFAASFDPVAIAETSEAIYAEIAGGVREISLIANIAREHRGRVPMAVASGGQRQLVMKTLTVTGLLPLFDHVVTVEDVGEGKPSPALFLEAARRLGIAPPDCLVFEDSDEGIEAARRAGMPSVDVREAMTDVIA